jgi:predicted nucleic acid-binding protein
MSISNIEVRRALRRIRPPPEGMRRRPDAALPFLNVKGPPPRLLYDTTVYIDQLQARLPRAVSDLLEPVATWHSSVAVTELLHGLGRLDPADPRTRAAQAAILEVLQRIPPQRVVVPDLATWRDAGLLEGVLGRVQQRGSEERRRTLNDALILLTARRHGLPVLTRNVADFDLLQQLRPDAGVLFYRV